MNVEITAARSYRAFTLLEIMISVMILAVAMSAITSSIFTMSKGSRMVKENQRAVQIAQALVERIQGAPWEKIGQQPWGWHRRFDAPASADAYIDTINAEVDSGVKYRPMVDEPGGAMNIYEFVEAALSGITNPLSEMSKDEFDLPYIMANQMSEFNLKSDSDAPTGGIVIPTDIKSKYDSPLRYNWLQFLGIFKGPSGLADLRVYVEYYDMGIMQVTRSRKDWIDNTDGVTTYQMPVPHLAFTLDDIESMDQKSLIVRIYMTWTRQNGLLADHEVILARRK